LKINELLLDSWSQGVMTVYTKGIKPRMNADKRGSESEHRKQLASKRSSPDVTGGRFRKITHRLMQAVFISLADPRLSAFIRGLIPLA
jgi:hypothetical protein